MGSEPDKQAAGRTMLSRRTLALIVGAALFGGLLAGSNVNWIFVAMPAWSKLNPDAWAAFSRHADLETGLVLYPVEALLGAVFAICAPISFCLDRLSSRRIVLPLFAAALLAVGGLLLTLKAAPVMLSLQHGQSSMNILEDFNLFRFWGTLRAACQITAFFTELWALAIVADGVRTKMAL